MKSLTTYFLLICFLLSGIHLLYAKNIHSDPSKAASSHQFLINADGLRRDNAAGQLRVYKDARIQLREVDKNRFKSINKKYKAAKSLYKKYSRLAKTTDKKIHKFTDTHPELYNHINRLSTENGNRVFAYIGSKERFSTSEASGETFIKYETATSQTSPQLVVTEEIEKGILLLHKQPNAVKITLSADGDLIDTRHELGHFEIAVKDSYRYFLFLSSLLSQGIKHDGHGHGDCSGHLAVQYEK